MCVKGLCQHCSSGDGFQLWDMNLQHFSWSNLTASASSPLSVSPQRIFNSFVYTEKTSNGETEVQQVSNKGFSFPLCVCVCVCVCVCLFVHACAMDGVCWLPLNWTQHKTTDTLARALAIRGKKRGLLKFYGCCLIGFEVLCLFFHLSLCLGSQCERRAAGRQNKKA